VSGGHWHATPALEEAWIGGVQINDSLFQMSLGGPQRFCRSICCGAQDLSIHGVSFFYEKQKLKSEYNSYSEGRLRTKNE
jgi:hypothetical protein